MMQVRYYKCPSCNKKFKTLSGWGDHVDKMHPGTRPKGYSISRYFYYIVTGKTNGICRTCKKPTDWNESSMKYNQYCSNPECKKAYVKIAKQRMVGMYGKEHLLDDPDVQKKMLSNRRISGKYRFEDGVLFDYTAKYERNFLEMLDIMLAWPSNDLMSPSPHIYYYDYENPKDDKKNWGRKFYIPDFYIPSLNLEIEIKQQTTTNQAFIDINRVKEALKDEVMKSNKNVNYLKINDNNFTEFFEFLMKAKEMIPEKKDEVQKGELAVSTEACEDVESARDFLNKVDKLSKKYDANFFIVTDGASMTRTGRGETPSAIYNARNAQKQWECENGFDPDEDWIKDKSKPAMERMGSTPFKSASSKEFKKKSFININSFTKRLITKQLIRKYKESAKVLKFANPEDVTSDYKGYIFTDRNDEFVAIVGVDCSRNGTGDLKDFNWITDIEVSRKYRGHGLSNQLLDIATKELGGDFLTVSHDNEIAINLYLSYGFKIGKNSYNDIKNATSKNGMYTMFYNIPKGVDILNSEEYDPNATRRNMRLVREKKYNNVEFEYVQESSNLQNEIPVDKINQWLKENGYKSGIKTIGDWGLKKFKSGETDTLFVISHPDCKKIMLGLRNLVSKPYFVKLDNYNTVFLKKKG